MPTHHINRHLHYINFSSNTSKADFVGNVEDSLYLNLTVSENEISLLLTDMGLEDFSYQLKAREQNKIGLLSDFFNLHLL